MPIRCNADDMEIYKVADHNLRLNTSEPWNKSALK